MRKFRLGLILAITLCVAVGCDPDEEDGTQFIVLKCIPSDLQTNVSQQSSIHLRFSRPVDHQTVMGTKQIILADQQNSIIPITYSFSGEIVTIQTGSPLAANATYGVAVRPGVKDIYGNNIEIPYAATFATGPSVAPIPNWPPFTIAPPTAGPPMGPPGTFSPVASLFIPRARHTATRLTDGRVIAIGGESVVGFGTVERTAEIFDPATLQWTMSASNSGLGMYFERAGHTAQLLDNGKILVVGGTQDGFQALNTAEIYDPLSDQFYTVYG
ncbi:MAG: Ig-like domain-containing protein, partial [Planctomycetota bacterium]